MVPYISPGYQSHPSYHESRHDICPTQETTEGERSARARRRSDGLPRTILYPALHRRAVSMEHKPRVRFDSSLEHVRTFYKDESPSQLTCGLAEATDCIHIRGRGSTPSSSFGSPVEGKQTTSTRCPRREQILFLKSDSAMENVHLEKLVMARDRNLRGFVLVRNLAYMKSVLCRFTLDRWATFSDVCANYSPRVEYAGETEGYDRFEFSINLLGPIGLGVERIILCVCFACNNQLYWDNNNGANYNILLAKQTSTGEEGPLVLDCRPLESISANHAQNIDRTMIDDVPLKINKPQTSVAKTPISFKQQLRAKQLPISTRSRADHWPSVSENHFLYSGWNEISCGE